MRAVRRLWFGNFWCGCHDFTIVQFDKQDMMDAQGRQKNEPGICGSFY